LVIAGLAVSAIVALPATYLVIRASGADAATWGVIARPSTGWLFLRSIGLAAVVTVASLAVGVPFAWLTVRTDLPARRVWATLLALPLVFPSYVFALAFSGAFGDQGMLAELFSIGHVPTLSGFGGAALVLTFISYPFVFLVVSAGLQGLDRSLEDAGRTLGRGRTGTLRGITLPLLRPAILAGALLVALYTLHDFGAVSLMRYETLTQAIFIQYRSAFDRTPAAILSMFLVLSGILILIVELRLRGRARYHRSGIGTITPPQPILLGRWKAPAMCAAGAFVLVALVFPTSVLLYWAGRGSGAATLGSLAGAALNAVTVSAGGACLALVAAVPIALLAARHPSRFSSALETTTYIGFALPGLVVALSMVFLATRALPSVYQSLPLVMLAYVVLFLPQSCQPMKNALLQLDPQIEDAARSLGRSEASAFRAVAVPLVTRPALIGGTLVFLTAMKELPATLLLRPTSYDTLATTTWSLASAGRYSQAALPALTLLLLCCIPLFALSRGMGRASFGSGHE
jgi:iron(III) transport system permease protein